MFWFSGHKAYWILAARPGIETDPLPRKAKSLPQDCQGSPNIVFIFSFIYLFLVAQGLCCCTWAFSTYASGGYSLLWYSGSLIAVASFDAKHRL